MSREEFNNSIADEAAQSCVDWSDLERRKEALRYIVKQIWNEATAAAPSLHKEGAGGARLTAEQVCKMVADSQRMDCTGAFIVDEEELMNRLNAALAPAGRAERGVKGFAGDPRDSK